VGELLSDLGALLERAGVAADESFAADSTSLRHCVPEIMAAARRLLDKVKAGELAASPIGEQPASARTSWL
jgi:hypothetical protein